LASRLSTYGYPDGISAYNAGRPISGNQLSYVQPVLAYQAWFQANDPLFGAPYENPPVPPGEELPGGVAEWLVEIFGPTPEPSLDPATGEVVSTDIVAGVGIAVILGLGVLWLLTRD